MARPAGIQLRRKRARRTSWRRFGRRRVPRRRLRGSSEGVRCADGPHVGEGVQSADPSRRRLRLQLRSRSRGRRARGGPRTSRLHAATRLLSSPFRFISFRVVSGGGTIGALVGSVERERREERNGRCRPPLTADGTPNVDLPGGRTGTGERVVLSRRCGCRGCRRCRWNGGPRGRHVDGRLELLAVLLLLLLGLLLVVGTRAVPAASAPVEHPPRKLEPRHLPDRSETSSLHLPLPVFRLARSPRGSTGDQARADRAAPRNYSKTRSRQLTARTKAKRRFEGARPERDGEKGRRSG